MANVIRVTPEKLTQIASGYEQTGSEIKSLTTSMTTTVQQLTGRVWSGEASNSYKSKFSNLQGDINKLQTLISDQANHLRTIAQEFSKAETENTAESSKLQSNVI